MYPYNNQNQLSQLLLQQTLQPQAQQTKVVEVTGRSGAEAFLLGPDSSTLLLDNTAPIVWLVKTDGAGYKSLIPYDIKPHEEEKPVDHYKALEERITKLEETINAKQSNTSNAKRKSESAE
jgi:hypothetical protein